MTATVHRWSEASSAEIGEALRANPIILLPIGAIEAHGPHLSSGADSVIASAVASRAAEMLAADDVETIVLPIMAYSVCEAGRPFPGTINVPAAVVTDLIFAICSEVHRHGGERICLHAHHWDPPHLVAIDAAVTRLATEYPNLSCGVFDRRCLNDEELASGFREGEGTGIRHGGRVETSMVLAEAPEQVNQDVMHQLGPVWVDLMAALRSGATNFAEAGGIDGYFGEPAESTVDEGERMIEFLASHVSQVARSL
jgi:creatinine amidohydrolase